MRAVLLILALCFSTTALASSQTGADPRGTSTSGDDGIFGNTKEWLNGTKPIPVETDFAIPPIAELKQWAAFSFPQLGKKNTHKLSLNSLTVGADQIVRYAVAVKPANGDVINVVYEGIDCATGQFRRYAAATSTTSWKKSATSRWQAIQSNSPNAWQGYLAEQFCAFGGDPLKLEDIKKDFSSNKIPNDCLGCTAK
ncbi:CNP1-like family protein [Chitinibacter sp. S2-10]|uniref:CNP1-like family protein n=1 Tax=Chitinibacter sp. S2-10 TaxID=3373597 RepID=UPI00397744E4